MIDRIKTRWTMCRVASALQGAKLVPLTLRIRSIILRAEQTTRSLWFFIVGIR